jgi:hypothetical protein
VTLKQNQFNYNKTKLLSDINSYYLKDALGERLAETIINADLELTKPEKKLRRSFLLGAIACMTVYEWGPGNEAVMGMIGVQTQNLLANPDSLKTLLASSLAVGAITGYATGAQQALSGTLMAGGVRNFPEAFKYWNKTKKREVNEVKKDKGDIATALVLGTSAAVIEQNARNPERNFKKDTKMALGMAAIIGTLNTALITGISAGVQVMDKAGLEKAANWTENIASNPLTYLAAFIAYKGYEINKENRKHKKYNQPLPTQ